ncbi:MAG: bifunctional oligoribonuclease/PAP phosphatase NrnA, partial [Paludibacteraceae bacterium]|nr:bifunctional oligoribonuclease/PAP phosphatase NrnA [Paludibacteraceae bacterium]
MITQEQIEAVAKLLPGREHVVILTHLSPDGDAMGSSLGLKLWLRSRGIGDVRVIVPNPFPEFLGWLPTADEILLYSASREACEEAVRQADLLFCVDFHEPKRIG